MIKKCRKLNLSPFLEGFVVHPRGESIFAIFDSQTYISTAGYRIIGGGMGSGGFPMTVGFSGILRAILRAMLPLSALPRVAAAADCRRRRNNAKGGIH
jgi:hypothetical protein